jgi:hypothetical protein
MPAHTRAAYIALLAQLKEDLKQALDLKKAWEKNLTSLQACLATLYDPDARATILGAIAYAQAVLFQLQQSIKEILDRIEEVQNLLGQSSGGGTSNVQKSTT